MKKKIESEVSCVWFPDNQICPIRAQLDNRKRVNATIKPKEDDTGMFSLVGNMMQQIPTDLTILPAYCNICHLRKRMLDK